MPPSRWDEIERRLAALETRHMELVQEVATHGAVCVERQKMILNTLAAIESQLSKQDTRLDDISGTLHTRISDANNATTKTLMGWLTAVASAGIIATASLAVLIMTRGLH